MSEFQPAAGHAQMKAKALGTVDKSKIAFQNFEEINRRPPELAALFLRRPRRSPFQSGGSGKAKLFTHLPHQPRPCRQRAADHRGITFRFTQQRENILRALHVAVADYRNSNAITQPTDLRPVRGATAFLLADARMECDPRRPGCLEPAREAQQKILVLLQSSPQLDGNRNIRIAD